MKKLVFPIVALVMMACGNNAPADNKEIQNESQPKNCEYTLNASEATVLWEAYKLTEKIGVGGEFDSLSFTSDKVATSVEKLLVGQTITIYTGSVNSKDVVRDAKLVEFFFQKMSSSDIITATIKSADGDNENGSAIADITLNGVTGEAKLFYSIKDSELRLAGEINVNNWQGADALASLNEVCNEKHTGPDGNSVLWPDVKVDFFVPINQLCE